MVIGVLVFGLLWVIGFGFLLSLLGFLGFDFGWVCLDFRILHLGYADLSLG